MTNARPSPGAPHAPALPRARPRLSSAEIEAANRAEATALLIRAGYRVYRPEADVQGEDLVIRSPAGVLRPVQLKARPYVDWPRYGGRQIWMLFPHPGQPIEQRDWFLVPHDAFFTWVKARHGNAAKWNETWSYPSFSVDLAAFLEPFVHRRW
jgi:hypothetical protein